MPDDEKLIRLLLRHIGDCLDETSLPGVNAFLLDVRRRRW